jgi:anti-sigma regulatory factor (Ser/Thr protein kinase)
MQAGAIFSPLIVAAWHIIRMADGTTFSHCHRAGDAVHATLGPAQAAVDAFAGDQALDTTTKRRLAIIVEELLVNVIDHASHGRDIALRLGLQHGEDGVVITIDDDSVAFDPRTVAPPELPSPDHGGGVGLAIVKAWADILSYDSENGRNRLVLRLRPRSYPG